MGPVLSSLPSAQQKQAPEGLHDQEGRGLVGVGGLGSQPSALCGTREGLTAEEDPVGGGECPQACPPPATQPSEALTPSSSGADESPG